MKKEYIILIVVIGLILLGLAIGSELISILSGAVGSMFFTREVKKKEEEKQAKEKEAEQYKQEYEKMKEKHNKDIEEAGDDIDPEVHSDADSAGNAINDFINSD